MTQEELRILKSEGTKKELLRNCSSSLFEARKHIEEAPGSAYANFEAEIWAARESIIDAEQLYIEAQKEGKTP